MKRTAEAMDGATASRPWWRRVAWGELGLGVLLMSSDLREIMQYSDRILIMRLGKMTHELIPAQTSEKQILHFVLGEEEEGQAAGRQK